MPKDNAYLEDILQAAKAIQRFLAGISLEDRPQKIEFPVHSFPKP